MQDTRHAGSGQPFWRRSEFSALLAGGLAAIAAPVIDELCLLVPPGVTDDDLQDLPDLCGSYSCAVPALGSTAVRQVQVCKATAVNAAEALATAVSQDAYNSMQAGRDTLIVDCGFEATRVIRVRGAGGKYISCDELPCGVREIFARMNVAIDKKQAGQALNIHRLVQTPVHVFEDAAMGLGRALDILETEEQRPLFRDITRFVLHCARQGPKPHSTVIVGGGSRLLDFRLLNAALGSRPAMEEPLTAAVRGALWHIDGWSRTQRDWDNPLKVVHG